MKKERKPGSGGARPGAGKKNQDKVRIGGTISRDLAERLDKERNKSAVLEQALRIYYTQSA